MKRSLQQIKPSRFDVECCPPHVRWPSDKCKFNSRRSDKAHSRDKKKEHRYVRHIENYLVKIGDIN